MELEAGSTLHHLFCTSNFQLLASVFLLNLRINKSHYADN
jgi:hypothetical protein